MSDKSRIEELEARIRALEARPVYVPIYVGAPQPNPCYQPWPYWQQPWIAPQPIWAHSDGVGAAAGGYAPTITYTGGAQ